MGLYHGSNVVVEKPIIKSNLRALDFGAGFYLTSNENQTARGAKSVAKRKPVLNIYQVDENRIAALRGLKFGETNGEWLDFVVANRKRMHLLNNMM